MKISGFKHEIKECEKTFESPNGLDGISLNIITPGEASKWRDFSVIKTENLHQVFQSFPEGLQRQLYELLGVFRYYTIDDEDLTYLLDWFTYVVSPSEYALWEESQEFQFQDLVEEYEDKLNQESLASKMKEEEDNQMSEICQEEYRKEIQARIQEILFK